MNRILQKSPTILPSLSTSIRSAAGDLGSPGIVMISPVRATTKPAPAETFRLRTVTSKSEGAPSAFGLSVREYWVFATQIGIFPQPIASSWAAWVFACWVRTTPHS